MLPNNKKGFTTYSYIPLAITAFGIVFFALTLHIVSAKNSGVAGSGYSISVSHTPSETTSSPSPSPSSTADTPVLGLTISNIKVIQISATKAVISWSTNAASNSFVNYGENTSYSNAMEGEKSVMSHLVYVNNLKPNTLYHFNVSSRNESDVNAKSMNSPDSTFRTLSAGFKRGDANQDGKVNVSDPSTINNYLNQGASLSCLDAADANDDGMIDVKDSEYILDFLFNGGAAPVAPGAFSDGTDSTPDSLQCRDYNVDYGLVSLSNISVSSITSNSASVVWNSNYPASGYITYSTDASVPSGSSYIQEAGDYRSSHFIRLTGLQSNKKYYYKVDSWITLSNRSISGVNSFATLQAQASPSPSPIVSPTPTPSVTLTPTPSPSASPSATASPTSSPVPNPSVSPSPSVSASPVIVSPRSVAAVFRRGDVNNDGSVDLSDLIVMSDYINFSRSISCLDAADVNDDGVIDISDFVYLSAWYSRGGAEPPAPGPSNAGEDPTTDTLGCKNYPTTIKTRPKPVVLSNRTARFPYGIARKFLTEDRACTVDLKLHLEKNFGLSIANRAGRSLFDAYCYGGYPLRAIKDVIANGPRIGAIHPSLEYPVWKKSADYNDYIGKFGDPATVIIIQKTFRRGDINSDGVIDISDVLAFANYINKGEKLSCLDAADTNDDGVVDLSDWVNFMAWFNGSGDAPALPGPTVPGADPTEDTLSCAEYPKIQTKSVSTPKLFRRGDINSDGALNISDILAFSEYLNSARPLSCFDAADVNDDGKVNISDWVYFSTWFTQGGTEPPAPGTKNVGSDPTADDLGCDAYPS